MHTTKTKIMEVARPPRSLFKIWNSLHESSPSFQNPQKSHGAWSEIKLACLMQVIPFVVGHRVVSQDKKKHVGEMMWLTIPSRKKDNSVKSGKRVEIKKKYLQAKRKTKSAV